MGEGARMLVSFFFLCSLAIPSSGTLVGFSYNARRSSANSSPIETISFLKENKVSPSQIRVFVSNHSGLNALSDSGVHVDLYLNESDVESLRKSKASAISQNITNVIVDSCSSDLVAQKKLSSLLASLETIHSALKSSDLNSKVKVAIAFPLTVLEKLERQQAKDLLRIVNFIKKSKSFVVLETKINGELSMGDRFVESMIKSAASAANVLKDRDVNVILNVKSTVAPSAIEVAEFSQKMMKSTNSHARIRDRISGIFAEITPMEESKQKELTREEEMIFHPSRRELNSLPISTTEITRHDTVIPTPTMVTVPSTNPVAITPVNPVDNPNTVPSTNPVVTTPVNPGTPPSTVPTGNTPTNPVTAVPPPGGNPITPPATTPTNPGTSPPTGGGQTNPGTSPSTGGGQTWCVAKSGAPESALQTALDYACGIGGADCSAIQSSGSCYNPNTQQNHASYAFNSYYQKNPSPTSCDFKGVATLTTSNPSTGSCIFPSSSGGGTSTPPSGTTPPTGTTPPGGATTPPGGITPPSTTLPTPFPGTSNSPPDFNSPAGFGTSPPPGLSTTESIATGLQPLCASTILALFPVAGRLLLDIGFYF